MGFFKKLLRIFQNAIECPDKFANDLFYKAPLKRRTIKLGATLFVRDNFVAVLVVKGKIADMFVPGKHKLVLAAMPKVQRRVNFKMRKKDKKPKDKFRGEIYFVNLGVLEGEFLGLAAFLLKDEKLGKVKCRANGSFSYTVSDATKFLEVCFLHWAYPKPQAVAKKINFWVMEESIFQLEALNPPLLEFAKNNPYLSERIKKEVAKKLEELGVTIQTYQITETFVPNQFVEQLEEALQDDESILVNDPEKDTAYIRNFDKELVNTKVEEELLYEQVSVSPYEHIAYGENVVSHQPKEHILLDERPNLNENVKFCNYCGATVAKDAIACYNCGNKLAKKRLCPSCNVEVEEGEFVCPNCKNLLL
jgi:membrane protease subunit (stomatin/prohibitin family)